MTWLPPDFEYPDRLNLATGHHLRPIRAEDAQIDYPAVMGSRESLWETYGGPWGWPPETMTLEADREDLAHHADEMEARAGFNYAILDDGETELFGCVYIYPPGEEAADADVSWWLVDEAVATDLESELARALPVWFSEVWGFAAPRRHP